MAGRLAFSAGMRAVWENAGRQYSELVEPEFVRAIDRALGELAPSEAFRGEAID